MPGTRLTRVLAQMGAGVTGWYRDPIPPGGRKRPGPPPAEFRDRYNTKRPHWALLPTIGGDPVTPEDVYVRGVAIQIPRWQAWAKSAKAHLDRLLAAEERAVS